MEVFAPLGLAVSAVLEGTRSPSRKCLNGCRRSGICTCSSVHERGTALRSAELLGGRSDVEETKPLLTSSRHHRRRGGEGRLPVPGAPWRITTGVGPAVPHSSRAATSASSRLRPTNVGMSRGSWWGVRGFVADWRHARSALRIHWRRRCSSAPGCSPACLVSSRRIRRYCSSDSTEVSERHADLLLGGYIAVWQCQVGDWVSRGGRLVLGLLKMLRLVVRRGLRRRALPTYSETLPMDCSSR
jgi:hypothetical protein